MFKAKFCIYDSFLQVGLCLAVGCVGISIIWSALTGFTPLFYLHHSDLRKPNSVLIHNLPLAWLIFIQILLSIAAWIYYMIFSGTFIQYIILPNEKVILVHLHLF